MSTENRNTEQLDHPPTPQELAEIYSRSTEMDPRSIYYQRTLVRPKWAVVQMLLYLLLLGGVGVLAYLGLFCAFHRLWAAVTGAVVVPLLLALLLAKPLLITLVKTYQAIAPAKVRRRCRYEPSCSVYMIQAVEKYGVRQGLTKGLKRWRGCKPPNGGFDYP